MKKALTKSHWHDIGYDVKPDEVDSPQGYKQGEPMFTRDQVEDSENFDEEVDNGN